MEGLGRMSSEMPAGEGSKSWAQDLSLLCGTILIGYSTLPKACADAFLEQTSCK